MPVVPMVSLFYSVPFLSCFVRCILRRPSSWARLQRAAAPAVGCEWNNGSYSCPCHSQRSWLRRLSRPSSLGGQAYHTPERICCCCSNKLRTGAGMPPPLQFPLLMDEVVVYRCHFPLQTCSYLFVALFGGLFRLTDLSLEWI